MEIKTQGKYVIITPESTEEKELVDGKVLSLLKAGYQVEIKKWGGFFITDPALKFKWEAVYIEVDVKRILDISPLGVPSRET